MYIKKLELQNFQKHNSLILDFNDKVNIIYGKTDSGKSCIVRALKWVFFGEPKGDIVRKENTKKTSVKVLLDNDTEIERIKSKTANAYIIRKDKEEKRYDSIGKTIPEDVRKILQINTIDIEGDSVILNIADQISLPFLLDKSATTRMKFFNKLTGNDMVDKVLKSFNSDILRLGREEKSEEQRQKDLKIKQEELTKKKKEVIGFYANSKEKFDKLVVIYNKYDKLNNLSVRLTEIIKQLKSLNASKKEMITDVKVDNLKEKIKKLERLQNLLFTLKSVKIEIASIIEKVKQINIPQISLTKMQDIAEKIDNYRNYLLKLKEITKSRKTLKSKIQNLTKDTKELINKYNKTLKEAGICPTCNQSTEEI